MSNLGVRNMPTEYKLRRPFLAHPASVFIAVWLFTMGLMAWAWIPAFTEHIQTALLLGSGLIVIVLFGSIFASQLGKSPHRPNSSSLNYRAWKPLFFIWMIISIFETILSGGLPIFWLVSGQSRTYEDFGVPTVHGFANAMWLFLAFTQFAKVIELRQPRRDVWFSMLLIIWPILLVSRALFTIFLLQFILFYFATSNKSIGSFVIKFVVISFIFSFAFGLAGDVRAPEFLIATSLNFDADQEWYVPLIWIYAYIVSPLATLALNWEVTTPVMHIFPSNSLTGLVPSVVREAMGVDTGFTGYLGVLAHDAFNVSTAFLAPYLDWGFSGIFLMAFFIGFFGHLTWRAALIDAAKLPILSAYNAYVALTIFTNQFTQLTPLLLLAMFAIFVRRTPKMVQSGSAVYK